MHVCISHLATRLEMRLSFIHSCVCFAAARCWQQRKYSAAGLEDLRAICGACHRCSAAAIQSHHWPCGRREALDCEKRELGRWALIVETNRAQHGRSFELAIIQFSFPCTRCTSVHLMECCGFPLKQVPGFAGIGLCCTQCCHILSKNVLHEGSLQV